MLLLGLLEQPQHFGDSNDVKMVTNTAIYQQRVGHEPKVLFKGIVPILKYAYQGGLTRGSSHPTGTA